MSTTFIVLCVFGFVGMLFIIVYAHKVDTLTTDNGILKHRNEMLEERFEKEDEQMSILADTLSAFYDNERDELTLNKLKDNYERFNYLSLPWCHNRRYYRLCL